MNSEISCKITNTKKAQNIITVSYQNKKKLSSLLFRFKEDIVENRRGVVTYMN